MDCPLRCSSFLPLRPERLLCRLAQPPSTGLGFPRWKRRESERCLVVCKAFGFDEQGGGSRGFSKTTALKVFMEEGPNKDLIHEMFQAIGAEYGEGFETFRPEGPLKVDVDFLNDRMQESCLQRIRYAMKPDEAFGLIFTWDNVLADTRALKLDAWYQLALEEGKDIPEDNNIRRTLTYAGADHIFTKVLHWVDGDEQLERLKLRLSELYFENLQNLRAPTEGVKEWLDALYTVGIPCAVTSRLDRTILIAALKRMGLQKYFQAMVTEEDGMDSIAHRFLSAAVKLDRRPSKCVVFEDDPRGITAAHNCTMMAVALIGARPAYELVQADLAVASFSELSIINLRRLFAHKGSAFMDLQKQIGEIAPRRRKLTIDTVF